MGFLDCRFFVVKSCSEIGFFAYHCTGLLRHQGPQKIEKAKETFEGHTKDQIGKKV
jgi:hypothetical protein